MSEIKWPVKHVWITYNVGFLTQFINIVTFAFTHLGPNLKNWIKRVLWTTIPCYYNYTPNLHPKLAQKRRIVKQLYKNTLLIYMGLSDNYQFWFNNQCVRVDNQKYPGSKSMKKRPRRPPKLFFRHWSTRFTLQNSVNRSWASSYIIIYICI